MDASKPERQRRWLPPLILLGALMGLGSGVVGGLTAETRGLRLVGWLLAAGGACNTVVAGWLWWWVRSGRGGPPPRH
jgi:hypothetical protein